MIPQVAIDKELEWVKDRGRWTAEVEEAAKA
jgi:hypothetical protein